MIRLIGVIVPRRLRADWKQEWESELRYREALLADWERLDWRTKLDLLWRSTSAFWDAVLLQPQRLEEEMFQDLRFGVRMLWKNLGLTVVVILTLTLGIGANVALFSVVNGVLLNPLPFAEPDQLVTLHQSKPNFAAGAIPYPNFLDLQKENQTFSRMAISRGASFNLIGSGEPERVIGRRVTADFFTVLGIDPVLGRNFTPDEDQRGAGPVIIISAGLWQRKFNSAPDTIGKSLTLDDKSYTIIGVLPASFALYRTAEVYVPMGQWNNNALKSRFAALGLHGIGRLKPGVTVEQAHADLNRVMQNLGNLYPDANRGNGAAVISLKKSMVGDVGSILWMLLGAVGFVLLIACVNVSNLLLARSTGRTREFAIRAALGAGQWRLLRQLLTESMLIALAGGALGLLVAAWGTKAALALLPTTLPRAEEIGLDARVLLFTCAISLLTGLISGLAPALKTSQWRLSETLKEGGRGTSGTHHRAQNFLVAVEMALALVLLVGAGLMIRSLTLLWNVDPGFRPDNVLAFGISLPPSISASPEAASANLRDLSDLLNSTPGVKASSFVAGAVPMLSEDDLYFWRDDKPKPASTSEMHMSLIYRVEPSYLNAMGIPLKQGRFFTNQDNERSPRVVVIDEVFARQFFPDADPIGKFINWGAGPLQIVGIVGHVKQWGLDGDKESLQAQLYEPFKQYGSPSNVTVMLRTEGAAGSNGMAHFETIRRVIRNQNGQNVIYGQQSMSEVISNSVSTQRFSMTLLNSFALVALLLASIGLYGVISYLVGQRRHELGVRIALGARRNDVLRLVVGHGMKMALAGVGLGLVSAFGLTRLMANMVFGVSTTDPITFIVIPILLAIVALSACFVPAWRATKVDPLVALRHE
jgi:predicted permease